MDYREIFERENCQRPSEPACDTEDPAQWVNVLAWEERFNEYLIEKLNMSAQPEASQETKCCPKLSEVRAIYDELLEEAMYLYQYYPNNFRKTAEEYFKKEIEMRKKISEHLS